MALTFVLYGLGYMTVVAILIYLVFRLFFKNARKRKIIIGLVTPFVLFLIYFVVFAWF